MRHISSEQGMRALREFAAANALVAFDYDGTLAPISSEPDRAPIGPRTRKLLRELALRYPCVLVSGRSRADARRRLRGIAFREIIGNHGIEPWNSSRAAARAVRRWIPILRQRLGGISGLILEDKGYSVSVHFRKSRMKKKVARAITEAAGMLRGTRLLGGKQVVNILPRGAPDKGSAVERVRQRLHCDSVLYAGDDESDEHVFANAHGCPYLTIRVGRTRTSAADFYLRTQAEMNWLLKTLLEFRSHRRADDPERRAAKR